MENFIFVIIGVLFFAFQTYTNYKKEQEKAKTRRPSDPRKVTSNQNVEERTTQTQQQVPVEIPRWLESILGPQPEPLPHQKAPRRLDDYQEEYSELPADLQYEYQNLPETKEIEELKKTIAIKKTNQYEIKSLKPYTFKAEEKEEADIPVFDLREAIIMSAILTRPEY